MAIRAVIFDLGGVIVRTENQDGRRKLEKQFGLPPGEIARAVFDCDASARASIGLADDDDVWQSVATRFGLDAHQLHEFQNDFWSGDSVDATLVKFLRDLRPRYKTAILSNAWPQARKIITEKLGLGNSVDTMIISAEEKIAKPDARIYHIASQRLNVQPSEAIFVDDLLVNAQAATATGMRGVHFKTTAQALAEVTAHLNGRA
jgi:epoxide hydrolase-like predicted phosphatase